MGVKRRHSERGIALPLVLIFTLILTITGMAFLYMSGDERILVQRKIKKTRAFHLAEAGIERLAARLYNRESGDIEDTPLGEGSYWVDVEYDENPPYAISTGKVGNEEKRVKVELSFLVPPYENGVYAGNLDGQEWMFELRGKHNPQDQGGREVGGKDIVNGNVFIDGNVTLYEQSSVNPAPDPNTYELNGDVSATGTVYVFPASAKISGEVHEHVDSIAPPDLVAMNYEVNNTHNVSQIFAEKGIDQGHLPAGYELYDVVVKNPSDREDECNSTPGDDYFFEPASGFVGGGSAKDAKTPLHLGKDRIYYVDGDVWFHSKPTYGFSVDGKVAIVATGDIHIGDNIKYADSESLLGLVALGKYGGGGQLESGGDIWFGDPRYGTMCTVSALMFAANNFSYNTDSVTGSAAEPYTGFSVYGNFAALNQISIVRDWFDDEDTGSARPACFDPDEEEWIDLLSGEELEQEEVNTLRHYQMIVNYDDRVRTQDTQPKGLPRGGKVIFCGVTHWEELPSS